MGDSEKRRGGTLDRPSGDSPSLVVAPSEFGEHRHRGNVRIGLRVGLPPRVESRTPSTFFKTRGGPGGGHLVKWLRRTRLLAGVTVTSDQPLPLAGREFQEQHLSTVSELAQF
jgi:hypothetical protein